jgi:hypothetical protein
VSRCAPKLLAFAFAFAFVLAARPASADPLAADTLAGGGAALRAVLAAPDQHRFQVLYAPVRDANADAEPVAIERHDYRADAEYFFPASALKMPIALAAFDRLAALRETRPWTRDALLRIFPTSAKAPAEGQVGQVTTLAHETWRALIVSDNASANRLLGFVGHREVHETLWGFGLESTRVRTGFATGAELDPARTSPRTTVTFADGTTAELPARTSTLTLPPTNAAKLAIGKAAIVNGKRVPSPMSFADKNAIRLKDLQDALIRIMRPELLAAGAGSQKKQKQTEASEDDLAYLRQALGTLPSESGLAGFDRNIVADYLYCPFLRGIERVLPRGRFRIYSKFGQAYGFVVANAYIVDVESGRAFFLAASIYANPEETMNSDRYAYETIAFPALADVAEVFTRRALGNIDSGAAMQR